MYATSMQQRQPISNIMLTVKLIQDKRKPTRDHKFPIKLYMSLGRKQAIISLGIFAKEDEWDQTLQEVVGTRQKVSINSYIKRILVDMQDYALMNRRSDLNLESFKRHAMSLIRGENFRQTEEESPIDNNILFLHRFLNFQRTRPAKGTRGLYEQTLRHLKKFDSELERRRVEDITKGYIHDFNKYLSVTAKSPNSRAIHMRNIRAVINDAIDDEVIYRSPFRKYTIETIETAKRSLKIDTLREFFSCETDPDLEMYRDYFKLSFMLAGINIGDMVHLVDMVDGRVIYNRAKTHKLYSIKVEPEALEIINKYKGEKYLINVMDRYTNHDNFIRRLNEKLRLVGGFKWETRLINGKKRLCKVHNPICPQITSYWARHSWATIAFNEVGIPEHIVSRALGHGKKTVTDIYIDFDQRLIDEANRKVLDYVLYGKK